MPNGVTDEIAKAGNTLGDWVTKYGIAVVFATILLCYFLWKDWYVTTATSSALSNITNNEQQLARSQADTASVLKELTLQIRTFCVPKP